MRKTLLNLLRVGVTAVGLAIVATQVDVRQIGQSLSRARPSWVLAGFLLINASLVVRAYRWHILLRGLGSEHSFRRLVELYFVGNFFNIALPSAFGGDVVRTLEATEEVPASVATGTVLLDRLTGLVMLFVMAVLMLPFEGQHTPAGLTWFLVAGAVLGVTGIFILVDGRAMARLGRGLPSFITTSKWTRPIRLLIEAVRACGWHAVLGGLGISAVFNLMLVGWWLTSGWALGQQVPFSYYLLIMPALSLPLLLPSISGLGPRELIAPTLFAAVGIAGSTAVSTSLLVFAITRISGLLGAPVYLSMVWRKRG
ncbi:MAG: lysylphosphatidylglycerol synthase transmembrane domain-containing protein [Anaerolineae bacterium]